MSLKVLVVDDDITFAEFARELLETLGYRAAICLEGKSALDAALAERPDLILMDYSMPEVNGAEAIRRLKAEPATHNIPIVLCSISDDPREVAEAMSAGADEYLPKPLTLPALERAIRRLT